MSAEDWTDERVERLRALWTQGLSASKIAAVLNAMPGGRLTRNAVIGKRTRAGLPDRLKTGGDGSVSRRTIKAKITIAKSIRPPKLKPQPVPKGAARPPSPEGKTMTWSQHRDFVHCAMFCEGESGDQGIVCGDPVQIGTVYCAFCRQIAYQPARMREAA